MAYRPGSFSKNFAWHGTGLRKLHDSIRLGFGSLLRSPTRDEWRERSGIGDRALELIPVNFFLHNANGRISVDELVFQAVTQNHSVRFDRLGLFAFHLNRTGTRYRGIERPAMWANEFVRDLLWQDGEWHSANLEDDVLDPFIGDHMTAQTDVRVKCRNNYRHLFHLCGYLPTKSSVINTVADDLCDPALFLAWDRLTFDYGSKTRDDLLAYVQADQLHKLLGITEQLLESRAPRVADVYVSLGGPSRFQLPLPTVVDLPEEASQTWLADEEINEAVGRRRLEVQTQLRDRRKAAVMRRYYENTCVFCGTRLEIGETEYYSEAAHVRPLGKPHNGPDKAGNMIVLCPNHHLQFDRGILRMRRKGSGYVIISRVQGDPLHEKAVPLRHPLDDECVQWHFDWFDLNRL